MSISQIPARVAYEPIRSFPEEHWHVGPSLNPVLNQE